MLLLVHHERVDLHKVERFEAIKANSCICGQVQFVNSEL